VDVFCSRTWTLVRSLYSSENMEHWSIWLPHTWARNFLM
jgi:hypothetical protein